MKTTRHILMATVALLLLPLASCDNTRENERIANFYLSQPRDPQLVGWWAEWDEVNGDSLFHWYRADGVVHTDLKYRGGAIDMRGVWDNNYWYTKDGNIHWFNRHDSWKSHSSQFHYRYEVRGDELWEGITDRNDATMYLAGKRTHPRL